MRQKFPLSKGQDSREMLNFPSLKLKSSLWIIDECPVDTVLWIMHIHISSLCSNTH